MEDRNLDPSSVMILHWIDTRKQGRTCILVLVCSRPTGGLLEQLLVLLHNIERDVVVLPLTLTQMNTEWSPETERGRALTEAQMVAAQMMSKRLRRIRQYL